MDSTLRYLKFFETHEEYEEYMNEVGTLPNVSYCEDNKELHFTPWTDQRIHYLIITFNVEDDTQPTLIYNNADTSAEDAFESILIDSEEITPSDLDNTNGLYQLSEGTHTIKYKLYGTTIGDYAFESCTAIVSVIIPEGVTEVGRQAFQDCLDLESVTLPNSVTTLGQSAFATCKSLTSINIPSGVESIDFDTFDGCEFTTIAVDNNNPTYDSRDYCNAIIHTSSNKLIKGCASTIIPNTVTEIATDAFYDCQTLRNITIPNSVTKIDSNAFYGCLITSVVIPSGVTNIGIGAFFNCEYLVSVTVEATTPPTASNLNWGAFDYNDPDRKIYVPSESVAAYKSASGWSNYASDIEAIPNV